MFPLALSASLLTDLSRPVARADPARPASVLNVVRGRDLAAQLREGLLRGEAERGLGVPSHRMQLNRWDTAVFYRTAMAVAVYEKELAGPVAGSTEVRQRAVLQKVRPYPPGICSPPRRRTGGYD